MQPMAASPEPAQPLRRPRIVVVLDINLDELAAREMKGVETSRRYGDSVAI